MQEQRIILSKLLNKYERSKHLLEPGTSNRRVMLSIDKKELPEYRYEDATVRDAFNAAVVGLEHSGLVTAEWFAGRPVLSAVILNLDNVEQCYTELGRLHPRKLAELVSSVISKELREVSTPWIIVWRDAVLEKAKKAYKVPLFCRDNSSLLSDLLIALREYDALADESITMRAFSSKCYQDTKKFEREVRDLFLHVASEHNADFSEACEREKLGMRDQLAMLGIYARPELYELSGNCVLATARGQIDIGAAAPYGLALPSTCVKEIEAIDLRNIQVVTFIENKTNYDEYILTEQTDRELVRYHGGFLSPQKERLFSKIVQSAQNDAELRLWADIDLGGFQMFGRLQRIIPNLRPMRMSGDDVERYHANGLARNAQYLERLRSARNECLFPLFSEAIDKILAYGVTIEQEAFLV